MRKLFSKILDIKNRFYSWILLLLSAGIMLWGFRCMFDLTENYFAWGPKSPGTYINSILRSMFAVSLIYISVLVFFILIFRMRINKTRLLLLTSISISLVIFSIPLLITGFTYPYPLNPLFPNYYQIPWDSSISFIEYLQYILGFINPIRFLEIIKIEFYHLGFHLGYQSVIVSSIKIFMISLSVYISCFLVIKNVLKINNFLNRKDLSFMNFIILLLGLAAILMFFYELFFGDPIRDTILNMVTGQYKFITIIYLFPFVLSQLYWNRKIRNSEFISSVFSVITIPAIFFSLYLDFSFLRFRDYLPSSFNLFLPSYIDMEIFLGIIFFPLTSFILVVLLYKQIKEYFVRKRSKDTKIDYNRRSFITSIFERLKK